MDMCDLFNLFVSNLWFAFVKSYNLGRAAVYIQQHPDRSVLSGCPGGNSRSVIVVSTLTDKRNTNCAAFQTEKKTFSLMTTFQENKSL